MRDVLIHGVVGDQHKYTSVHAQVQVHSMRAHTCIHAHTSSNTFSPDDSAAQTAHQSLWQAEHPRRPPLGEHHHPPHQQQSPHYWRRPQTNHLLPPLPVLEPPSAVGRAREGTTVPHRRRYPPCGTGLQGLWEMEKGRRPPHEPPWKSGGALMRKIISISRLNWCKHNHP